MIYLYATVFLAFKKYIRKTVSGEKKSRNESKIKSVQIFSGNKVKKKKTIKYDKMCFKNNIMSNTTVIKR